MNLRARTLLLAPLLAVAVAAAFAQDLPEPAGRLIVPFAPGGFTDVVARILGQKLSAALGQQFMVENKAGAGSTIGTDFVAKSPPDGYTLVMVSSTHVISPWIYKTLPYDPIKSFTVMSKLVDSPYVLLVNPKVPAQQRAGVHRAGQGLARHGALRFFGQRQRAAPDGRAVRGDDRRAAQARAVQRQRRRRQDLVAGVVESSFAGVPNALAQVPQGRLRALAVTTAKRIPQLPGCADDAGGRRAGYEASVWLALAGAGGHAADIVASLNSEDRQADGAARHAQGAVRRRRRSARRPRPRR